VVRKERAKNKWLSKMGKEPMRKDLRNLNHNSDVERRELAQRERARARGGHSCGDSVIDKLSKVRIQHTVCCEVIRSYLGAEAKFSGIGLYNNNCYNNLFIYLWQPVSSLYFITFP
jgi:hypothetical protein